MTRAAVLFRLSHGEDPEENLEEAALWKALHDEMGSRIAAIGPSAAPPSEAIVLGRPRRTRPPPELKYWCDPAFLEHCNRTFTVHPISEIGEAVARLHANGKGAFLKSCQSKHWIGRVPVGEDWRSIMGDMVFSFIDGGPEIMVQQLCEIRYEHRFFVINRRIVTRSPIASHLTPLDFPQLYDFETPQSEEESLFTAGGFLSVIAERVAQRMRTPDAVVDCALIDGKPGCIELNPWIPGGVGLFACDVRALARAIAASLDEPLAATASDR